VKPASAPQQQLQPQQPQWQPPPPPPQQQQQTEAARRAQGSPAAIFDTSGAARGVPPGASLGMGAYAGNMQQQQQAMQGMPLDAGRVFPFPAHHGMLQVRLLVSLPLPQCN